MDQSKLVSDEGNRPEPLPVAQYAEEKAEEGGKGQEKSDQLDTGLSLATRLMISSELLGHEASVNFSDLYAVPNLQNLGMPLSLVSLTGLISGPAAIILLPLMGWFSDRGINFRRRRMYVVILATMILAVGALTVIIANLLHVTFCNPGEWIRQLLNKIPEPANMSADAHISRLYQENKCNATGRDGPEHLPALLKNISTSSQVLNFWKTEFAKHSAECFPAAPGIAMFGYILIEIGYSLVTAVVRTWMLTCSPPSAATPTLVAGLVMTSSGGILTSALGMIDLPSVFQLSSVPQFELKIQVSMQAAVVITALLAGMITSLLAGHRQLKRLHSTSDQHQKDLPQEGQLKDNIHQIEHEILIDMPKEDVVKQQRELSPKPEKTPVSYGTMTSTFISKVKPTVSHPDSSHGIDGNIVQEKKWSFPSCSTSCSRRRWGFRTTIAILNCCMYFTAGAIMFYKMTISDFVGKAIFHGDPDATSETDALARYEEGLRISSYGFLANYGIYLVFSFVQKRVLSLIGYTLEFVTIALLLSVSLIVLSLTAKVETYFLLSAVSGVHKAVFNMVPVAVLNEVIHAETQRRGDSHGLQLAMAMSLMFLAVPLAKCTLYPWLGTVMELTAEPAIPLLLAAAFSCVSAALFSLLGA